MQSKGDITLSNFDFASRCALRSDSRACHILWYCSTAATNINSLYPSEETSLSLGYVMLSSFMMICSTLLMFLIGISSQVVRRFMIHCLNSKCCIIFFMLFQDIRLFIFIGVCGGVGDVDDVGVFKVVDVNWDGCWDSNAMAVGVTTTANADVWSCIGRSWFTDNRHKHSHTICSSEGGAVYHVASDSSRIEILIHYKKMLKMLLLVNVNVYLTHEIRIMLKLWLRY